MQDENRIIHLWREILTQAIESRATDIHIEPSKEYTLIRCRIDGVLQSTQKINSDWHDHLSAHIKIQASLDIAEKRLPQDGRLSFNSIDCRVSSIPTINGEKIVVRILLHDPNQLDINQLGFTQSQLEIIKGAIEEPQGLCLITGPTGSGKTLTLYTLLKLLNDGTKNISAVEDPVEIRMLGINQISVNEKIGLNFASVLRALLRQDPDIILIGEIRDLKTAQIALQASQTGHLVLASLHTNNAIGAVTRLVNLGCDKELIASCLHFVSAQRLIRKICSKCNSQNSTTTRCAACNSTGYQGRVAVHEVLKINNNLKNEIYSGRMNNLLELSKQSGMKSLFENGMELVARKVTNTKEIQRQIGQQF